MVSRIRKRDGRIVDFDQTKIAIAIGKAIRAAGLKDSTLPRKLAQMVAADVGPRFPDKEPSVEDVQDAVERVLIKEGQADVAKRYILYRAQHAAIRESKKALLGGRVDEQCDLSINAITVLERRYLLRDKNTGNVSETPSELFWRVARNVAQADELYGGDSDASAARFFSMMCNLEFLPNSPTLMNAGTDVQQLSACFVVGVPDTIEGIFDALKHAAIIHKSGGGTGFSFTRLRPKGDLVKSTMGVSSGPISFMRVFDAMTQQIKQGGKRRGANMGVLRVDHPDILEFINLKADGQTLSNFNISVAITDEFMEAVERDAPFALHSPRDGSVTSRVSARALFDNIVAMAWARGDPGLLFIDKINAGNPCKHLGRIEATNPCGEQPLLPYESCNLGSINLAKCFTGKDGFTDKEVFDWEKLRRLTHDAVHFLDNVIDVNRFPIHEIERMTRTTRKIGLGVMGFADVLYRMGVAYDSDEGLQWGERIMRFIYEAAEMASEQLAHERGCFPAWEGSEHQKTGKYRRNSTLLTVAPTGTLSMIAETSGGLEPNFALAYIKNVMDGTELVYSNAHFERVARSRCFWSETLMREIARRGSIRGMESVPADVRNVFVTAMDIAPEWHIKMQAAFQRWCDSSISKTINFPSDATIDDVRKGYVLAWQLGCKGVTVYRDKSLDNQVLNIASVNRSAEGAGQKASVLSSEYAQAVRESAIERCPDCKSALEFKEGCSLCPQCGHSKCSLV